MYDGTYNALCFFALMLCAWLIATGINDAIELNEQKTQERRAKYRGVAFADMAKKRQINENRETLWREVDYL